MSGPLVAGFKSKIFKKYDRSDSRYKLVRDLKDYCTDLALMLKIVESVLCLISALIMYCSDTKFCNNLRMRDGAVVASVGFFMACFVMFLARYRGVGSSVAEVILLFVGSIFNILGCVYAHVCFKQPLIEVGETAPNRDDHFENNVLIGVFSIGAGLVMFFDAARQCVIYSNRTLLIF